MRQAKKLMEKHGLTVEDVGISDIDSETVATGSGKTPPRYIAMLANAVTSAFGSECVHKAWWNTAGDRLQGRFEFFGVDGAGEVSAYAFLVLLRRLKRDRNAYLATLNKRLKRATRVRRGDLYAEAWIYTVAQQIDSHQRTEPETTLIEAYKKRRFGNGLSTMRGRDNTKGMSQHDSDAQTRGFRDGKKVGFYKGVNGSEQVAIESGGQS